MTACGRVLRVSGLPGTRMNALDRKVEFIRPKVSQVAVGIRSSPRRHLLDYTSRRRLIAFVFTGVASVNMTASFNGPLKTRPSCSR